MNDAPNIAALLDRAPSDVERPKPLPIGGYHCILKGVAEHGKSSKKGTPFVKFNLQPTSPMEDVDEEALTDWMQRPDGTSRTLADAVIDGTFYLTEGSLFMLKDFLEHTGAEGETLRAQIDGAQNSEVIAYIKHEPTQDGQGVRAVLGRTAPVEG